MKPYFIVSMLLLTCCFLGWFQPAANADPPDCTNGDCSPPPDCTNGDCSPPPDCTNGDCPNGTHVTFDWATVGNPGNGPEGAEQGAVSYVYRISKYEVTNAQYTEFLNAVDPMGINPNLGGGDPFVYSPFMSSDANGGIDYDSGAENGSKYHVKNGRSNNPVIYVSFFDAMRFTNWLQNGQGSGSTESGVYTIGDGLNETRNPNARYFIPSDNEWWKAAYHKNDGVTANYWNFATGTDAVPYTAQPPGNGAPVQSNTVNGYSDDLLANGYNDGYAVTGSTILSGSQNYLTDVGAYTATLSPYGTFDQQGNVLEWTEFHNSGHRLLRGGDWSGPPEIWGRNFLFTDSPAAENSVVGFRVASIPEPSTMLMGALASIGMLMRRRRLS